MSGVPSILGLDGEWEVTRLPLGTRGPDGLAALDRRDHAPIRARVPGEIHLDLMAAGMLDDPDVLDVARTTGRDPERHSWWYRHRFEADDDLRGHDLQRLVFDGIDHDAEIYLNGEIVAASGNAFAPVVLDVAGHLRAGGNELVVRVTSGAERPAEQPPRTEFAEWIGESMGVEPLNNWRFLRPLSRALRKPAAVTHGWDFCDPLPNVGIWGGVRLEGRSDLVIEHVRLDTEIADGVVSLVGEVQLRNLHTPRELRAVVEVNVAGSAGPAVVWRREVHARSGFTAVPCRIVIPDAELWWPNGMGAQPLYDLTVTAGTDGVADTVTQRIGLRTIELDRSTWGEGSRFAIRVNGQDVFCKGGNWAPPDLISSRMTADRYRHLVEEAARAHFTMFRVNGVGLYESEDFYDACDRAGILVWQDFTFAFPDYPIDDPGFMAGVRAEAEAAVKRLRHRASLALWCGCNEVYSSAVLVESMRSPHNSAPIYDDVLPRLCHALDPLRPYWSSSPYGGDDTTSPLTGDWHGFEAPDGGDQRMAVDAVRGRFYSEFFAPQSPPHLDSIREYLRDDAPSRDGEAFRIHTNAMVRVADPDSEIRARYGEPDGLDLPRYVLYGQLAQAVREGAAIEGLRFRKHDPDDDCSGGLMWSYNDTWGEIGWSIIDHYARRKAGYYWFRRGARPIKVITRRRGDELVTRVVNDTLTAHAATVTLGWIRLDGSDRALREQAITIPANGAVEVAREPVPEAGRDPRHWAHVALLRGPGIEDDQSVRLLAPHRELELARPDFSVEVVGDRLVLRSDVYCHAVHLDDGGREVLADNYVELLPGVPLSIPMTAPVPAGGFALTAVLPFADD